MNNREMFKEAILKKFGNENFLKVDAKAICDKLGFTDSQFKTISTHVLRHIKVDKGIFAFPTDHAFGSGKRKVKSSPEVVKASKKKTLKSDLAVINEAEQKTPEVKVVKASVEKPKTVSKSKTVQKTPAVSVSLIPQSDPQYVSWGHFKDIKTIISSKIFYPVFVTGLSGNGKTSMIHEVCAKLKRDLVRVNITIETDEDDLLGGFRLVDGETVWQDGPIINAMRRGSISLVD